MGLRRGRPPEDNSSGSRQTALGASRWLNYVGPVGVWPRPETVQLFGCYVIARREAFGLSQEGLAESSRRSSEWLANVERGACCPTDAGFLALTRGFHEATTVDPGDLRLVFDRLDIEPYGKPATTLRSRFSLDPPLAEVTTTQSVVSDSWVPISSETRYHDRLTTIPPLFLVAAAAYVLIFGKPWRGNGLDLPAVGLGDLALIALIAVTILATGLPRLSEALGILSAKTRPQDVRKNHERCQKIRGSQRGIETTYWFLDDESPFLVARYRNEARQKSLEADLVERTTLALYVSIGVIAIALALALGSSTAAQSWLPWLGILCVLLLFVRSTVLWWMRLSKVLPEILVDGYGARPTPVSMSEPPQLPDSSNVSTEMPE